MVWYGILLLVRLLHEVVVGHIGGGVSAALRTLRCDLLEMLGQGLGNNARVTDQSQGGK